MGWTEGVNALAEAINTRQGEWFLQQFTWVLVCDYTYIIDFHDETSEPAGELLWSLYKLQGNPYAGAARLAVKNCNLESYKKKEKKSSCCPHKKLQAGLLDSRIIMRGRRCIGLVWHIPTNHLISIAEKTVLETHHHHPQAAAAAAAKISTS